MTHSYFLGGLDGNSFMITSTFGKIAFSPFLARFIFSTTKSKKKKKMESLHRYLESLFEKPHEYSTGDTSWELST